MKKRKEDGVAIHEKVLGPDHLYVAADLNNLGGLHAHLHRWREAVDLLTRGFGIREKDPEIARSERLINISNVAEPARTGDAAPRKRSDPSG